MTHQAARRRVPKNRGQPSNIIFSTWREEERWGVERWGEVRTGEEKWGEERMWKREEQIEQGSWN
jgi:hypothetical protein